MYRLFMIILFLLTILYVKSEEAALTRKEHGKRQISLAKNPIFSLVFQTNCSLPSIFFRRGCEYSNLGYSHEASGQVLAPAPIIKTFTTEKSTIPVTRTFKTKKTTTPSLFPEKYESPENINDLYGIQLFPPLTERKENFIEPDNDSDKKFSKYNFKDYPIPIKMTPVVNIPQNQPNKGTNLHTGLPTFETVNFFEDDTKRLDDNKKLSFGNNNRIQGVEEKLPEVEITTTDNIIIVTNVYDVDFPEQTSSKSKPEISRTTTIAGGVLPNSETESTDEENLINLETQQKVTVVEPPQKNQTFFPSLDIERIKPLNPHYYKEVKAIKKLMEEELKETIEKSLCNATAVRELWEDRMKLRRDFDIPTVRVDEPYLFRQLAMIDQWLANDLEQETKKCTVNDLNPEKYTFKRLPMFERYQPFKVVSKTNNPPQGGLQEDLAFASSDINEVIPSDKPSKNEALKPEGSTTNVISFVKNEKSGKANHSVPVSTGIPFEANAGLNTPPPKIGNPTKSNFQRPVSFGSHNSNPMIFAVPHYVRYQKFKSNKTDDSITTTKTVSSAQNKKPTELSTSVEPQTTSAAGVAQSNIEVVPKKTQKPKILPTSTSNNKFLPNIQRNYIFKKGPLESEKINGENTEKDPFIAFIEQYPGFKDIFSNTSTTEMLTPLRGDVPANSFISSKILFNPEINEIITNNLQNTVNDSEAQNPTAFLKKPLTEDPNDFNWSVTGSTEVPQATGIEKPNSLQKQTNFVNRRPGPVVFAVPHYIRHQVFNKSIKNEGEQAATTEKILMFNETGRSNKKVLVKVNRRPVNQA